MELTEASRMTLGAWLDKWLTEYKAPMIRKGTADGYRRTIDNHIKLYLGDKPITQVTTADVQKMYNTLKESGRIRESDTMGKMLSNSMIRSVHMLLHEAMDSAVREGLLPCNPTKGATIPKKEYKEKRGLLESQTETLVQAVDSDEIWRDFFKTELMTGMRRGELLALQWDDVNFTTGEVKISRQVQSVKGKLLISQPKTKSSVRSIILPPALIKVLKDYKQTVNSRWLFPSPLKEDVPREPTSCRKRLSKILEHAGCKHVRFHDLRHTFATHAIQYGMDVKTLAATIGHTSVETTLNIYSHVTDEMQKNAAQKIDQTIGAVTGVRASCEENAAETGQSINKEELASFEPYKGVRRSPGTGCISQISETTWEGRYSPRVNGKKITRNVCAHSLEECEEKLAEMIREMKEEITAQKLGR